MKISKEAKEETRRRIVAAAVEVFAREGVRNATMREIAERAKVGDATIYKYFPTKESLLFGYFEVRMEDLIARLREIDDFHQYAFREQLHVLLETQLELFDADRAFVRAAYRGVFLSNWLSAASASKPTKERFLEVIDDLVGAAVEAGEFEDPPFRKLLYELLWEHTIGITCYWLEDQSPKYANTTQVIDKSLGVLDAALKSNIMSRAIDLAHFLLREHLLAKIQRRPTEPRDMSAQPKREFMADREPEGRAKKPRAAKSAAAKSAAAKASAGKASSKKKG